MIRIFKTGDAVVSNTSDITMTIDYRTKTGAYNCRWYEGSVLKEAQFAPEILNLRNRKLS